MISSVRAAPKSEFLGVMLGSGGIHALKRCFILTISLSLYSLGWMEKGLGISPPCGKRSHAKKHSAGDNHKETLDH